MSDDHVPQTALDPVEDGTPTMARKVLATAAFGYLGVTGLVFVGLAMLSVISGPQAGVSHVRAVVESFLRFPRFGIVSLVAANALLTAEIMVEMVRFGTPLTRSWSDKRHLAVVLLTWIALASGQLLAVLVVRQHLMSS